MLMGEYAHTIDAKGRVILPADFRAELGESFVITKGLDNCLFVYGQEEWASLSAKLRELPLAKSEARAFVRFFFSGARQLECDRQGRFLVPGNLRQYALLEKDVVLIGKIAGGIGKPAASSNVGGRSMRLTSCDNSPPPSKPGPQIAVGTRIELS